MGLISKVKSKESVIGDMLEMFQVMPTFALTRDMRKRSISVKTSEELREQVKIGKI